MSKRTRSRSEGVLFWVVSGVSGAGKSQAINCFEDFGFFCVDNLPMALVPKLAELCAEKGKTMLRVALGIDIREGEFLRGFFAALQDLKERGIDVRILYLDADDQALIRRFSETRRRHPLGKNVREGIKEERRRLLQIKGAADKIIDTSGMTLSDLKETLSGLLNVRRPSDMQLAVVSFGYKHGLPLDADIVWDVRFLPNPNYVRALQPRSGQDPTVRRYVLASPEAQKFQRQFFHLLESSLPHFAKEGKSYLTIAVGCTGGRHRSVVIAEALQHYLVARGYSVRVQHRDITHHG